jgi:hypothetical protein
MNYERWKDNRINYGASPLFSTNKELLNRYFNQLKMYSMWCWARLGDLQQLKKRNAELIEFFKKKNHFQ